MAARVTDTEIRNLKPREKLYRVSLGEGFCIIVNPDGSKYWRLRYSYGGLEKMLALGVYAPDTFKHVTLKEATQRCAEAKALLLKGIDPNEDKRQRKLAIRQTVARTFGDAANKWFEHNTPRWKPATIEKVDQYLRKDILPPLASRPLANITAPELDDVVKRIEQRKAHNVAKKSRQWLTRIFEYAIAKGLTTHNPAEHLGAVAEIAPETKNHAHLALYELPAFLRALDDYTGSELTKVAVWLALWTASRPGVLRTLRWAELDLDDALWTIEKGREGMKKGYAHLTPLPTQAVDALRRVHRVTGTFEYVFINRNDPRRPMSEGAVAVLLKAIGYAGKQTGHGFRHLLSTALNEQGYHPDWIERQLAHGDPDAIRDTYNKAHYLDERRTMMQAWADYLDRLKEGTEAPPKKSGTRR